MLGVLVAKLWLGQESIRAKYGRELPKILKLLTAGLLSAIYCEAIPADYEESQAKKDETLVVHNMWSGRCQ